jgi:hypothetical protein
MQRVALHHAAQHRTVHQQQLSTTTHTASTANQYNNTAKVDINTKILDVK